MLLLVVVNRLLPFIHFCFTVLGSEPSLQAVRGRMCPLFSRVSGANGPRNGGGVITHLWARPPGFHRPHYSLAQQIRRHRLRNLLVGHLVATRLDRLSENRNTFLAQVRQTVEVRLQSLNLLTVNRKLDLIWKKAHLLSLILGW